MIDAQPLAAVQKLGGKSFRRAGARIILALASAIYLAPQTLAGLRVTETAGGITTPGERTSLGAAGQTQPDTGLPYQTVFYNNGNLSIEAYLFLPQGEGPFPVVVYNHGSRIGQERLEVPFTYVGTMLAANGYAVFVPERRGYGKSDGETWSQAVGDNVGQKFINRLHLETTDVLAGIDYLKTVSSIDTTRVGVMGWSLGGIITVFAATDPNYTFFALSDQAGGALTWDRSPLLQQDLPAAAQQVTAPSLCMDAENDATTDAVTVVGAAIRNAGTFERTIIYPPFTPTSNPHHIAPGHLIFSIQGISIWENDVVNFLNCHIT